MKYDQKKMLGYYGRQPNCLDCGEFYRGCQWLDWERSNPDAAANLAMCQKWADFRREERRGRAIVKAVEHWWPAAADQISVKASERKEVRCMSELDNAKARSDIFEYLQLKAKMDHLEAEGAVIKARLDALMKSMGVTEFVGSEGTARIITKHSYSFNVPEILKVAPEIAPKLKLSNEDFNKVLVGREVALAPFRTVLGSTSTLTVSANKKAK